jgi:3-deoxy-D-manno-octulosonic-acid transferase
MDRFATDPAYLMEQGQRAGQFVKGQAGAARKVLSNIKLQ